MSLRPFVASLLLLLFPSLAHALANNNVRVDKFKWMHVQTQHFDIYYDSATAAMVPRMAFYLENAWKEVGDKIKFQVPGRTPFFFFSDHNRFEQTNVVPIGEGTGGVTEAFKNRFLIFNDGSEAWLQHVIYHEFGHVVQFNVLFGGFWKSIRLLKSPFYPLWFMEGMAEFVAGEIDAPMGDMFIRDALANDQLPHLAELQGFGHLKPNQITLGYKTGEAALHFLEDEYGQGRAHDLLVTLKDHFDVSSALDELLGCDLERFDFRFREWLRDRYASHLKRAQPPTAYGPRLTTPDGIPQFNEAPVLSADGKKLYFFSDKGGPTQLFEHDFETKKSRPILTLKWSRYENLHPNGRALSLSSDGRWLAFAGEKKQKDFLYLFDLKRSKLKRVKTAFDEIRSPVFSPTKDVLLITGMTQGYNDLYLINRQGETLERLTDNPQDERHPTFSADGRRILYSGEVLTKDPPVPAGWDLYEISRGEPSPRRLTDFEGVEGEPEALPDGSIIFVRDRNDQGEVGFNLYRWVGDSSRPVQLTDFVGGGFSPRYWEARNALVYVGFHAGEKHIYEMPIGVIAREPGGRPKQSQEIASSLKDAPRNDTIEEGMGEKGSGLDATRPDPFSPLLTSPARPYRFKASTDLFLPFFFYSTVEGLVVADVWWFSELMGNHQFQQQMQYASGNDFLDLGLAYTYARFRPQFTLAFETQRFYRDFDKQDQRRQVTGIGLMSYPLDRVNSVNIGAGTEHRKDIFLDDEEEDVNFQNRFYFAGLFHDTVTGRYLIPTKGRRASVYFQQGLETLNGNQQYRSGGLEAAQYLPLPGESTLASRIFYGRSVGENPQVFRMGGIDRIRALPSGSLVNRKSNVVLTSAEARLRIKYLNARTKFLFPDFFFKAAYLILFDDVGYGWDSSEERDAFTVGRAHNSAGAGISWPTFILQTFKIDLTILWAKRTDDGADVWYVAVGPSF